MSGLEHYREGEHPLGRCLEFGHGEQRQTLAIEATAHLLAALVALHAANTQPDSITWQEALG